MPDAFDAETGEIMAQHRRSEPANEIFAALAKAQGKIENADKTGKNPHFNSKYVTLGAALESAREALSEHELAVVQMPVNGQGGNIGVVTLLGHASGQWIESTLYVAPMKFDAQGAGSVITYLRRYALMAMVGLAPEDDDGEAAVQRPAASARLGAPTPNAAPPAGLDGTNRVNAEGAFRRIRAAIAAATSLDRLNEDGATSLDRVRVAEMKLIMEVSPRSHDRLLEEDAAKRLSLAVPEPDGRMPKEEEYTR